MHVPFLAKAKIVRNKMNFSWASSKTDDGEGNEVSVFIWISGDWKIEYKGKEYIVSLDDTISALLDKINEEEK